MVQGLHKIKSKPIITSDQDLEDNNAARSETVKGKNNNVGDGDDNPNKVTKGLKPPTVDDYGYPPIHDLKNPLADEPYAQCIHCVTHSIPCHRWPGCASYGCNS